MRLKNVFIFVVATLNSLALFCQTKQEDSSSKVFPKVLVVNHRNEVLLAFDKNRQAYEVPSIGYMQGAISFKTYIDSCAREMGISYSSFYLAGIFTYVSPGAKGALIRPYFIVKSHNVNCIPRTETGHVFFPLENALEEIKYPASRKIVEQIMAEPRSVWSATFEEYGYTNPVDTSKIKFRIIEPFYKLD